MQMSLKGSIIIHCTYLKYIYCLLCIGTMFWSIFNPVFFNQVFNDRPSALPKSIVKQKLDNVL